MELIRVHPVSPDPDAIERAAAVLRNGGLVAFPTETVYGLGAHALDVRAVARIFEAKGRPPNNPLIVHVPEAALARELARTWPAAAELLASAFWPGPLTLIVEKQNTVPDLVTAGLPTVALRVPAHPVALALLRAAGVPVAAPSANRFTSVSPTAASHVIKELGESVDVVLDGGRTEVGIESTVVDVTEMPPRVLRPGTIPLPALESVVGSLDVGTRKPAADEARPSPGLMARHYAPRAVVRLFTRERVAEVVAIASEARRRGGVQGGLVFGHLDAPIDHEIVMPPTPAGYAENLYAALHALDDLGCGIIWVEEVPAQAEWLGIRDRLRRAATPEPGGDVRP